jgi:hypothetical protein
LHESFNGDVYQTNIKDPILLLLPYIGSLLALLFVYLPALVLFLPELDLLIRHSCSKLLLGHPVNDNFYYIDYGYL